MKCIWIIKAPTHTHTRGHLVHSRAAQNNMTVTHTSHAVCVLVCITCVCRVRCPLLLPAFWPLSRFALHFSAAALDQTSCRPQFTAIMSYLVKQTGRASCTALATVNKRHLSNYWCINAHTCFFPPWKNYLHSTNFYGWNPNSVNMAGTHVNSRFISTLIMEIQAAFVCMSGIDCWIYCVKLNLTLWILHL